MISPGFDALSCSVPSLYGAPRVKLIWGSASQALDLRHGLLSSFLSFFLAVFLFGLRSTVSSSRPTCQTAGARRVGQGDPHLRAREGLFVLDGPEHTGRDLERVGATTYDESRDRPLIRQRKKTAEPYIRRDSSSSPNPYPTCWEVRGRAGRDQSFGRHIEAMNGPGHTSIPVRRVTRRASASPGRASDKLVTPP